MKTARDLGIIGLYLAALAGALVVILGLLASLGLIATADAYPADAETACRLCGYNPIFCYTCAFLLWWEYQEDPWWPESEAGE